MIAFDEDSEVDNRLEKLDFADLVKDAKSAAGFSPSRQFRVGLAAKTVSKWRPPKSLLSRRIIQDCRHFSRAETSVSGKAECFLAIGEDKKVSFLE